MEPRFLQKEDAMRNFSGTHNGQKKSISKEEESKFSEDGALSLAINTRKNENSNKKESPHELKLEKDKKNLHKIQHSLKESGEIVWESVRNHPLTSILVTGAIVAGTIGLIFSLFLKKQ